MFHSCQLDLAVRVAWWPHVAAPRAPPGATRPRPVPARPRPPRGLLCARAGRAAAGARAAPPAPRAKAGPASHTRAHLHEGLRGPSTDWVPSPGVLATPGPSPGEVQLPPGGGMRGGGAAPLASDAAAALPPPERRVLERGLLAKGRVGAATAHHRQCCGLCRQQPPHGAGHAATARGQAPWRGTGCGNSSGQGSWPRCPYRHRGGRPPGV
ncbi:unnamed protein product [Prorocentrum cordatum]|uniref:Uncharacterized protein n=1 Tax=Prorocentrum cordatum TaxID=2364126 RepID=A0ABN9V5W3_9DINO|nr:unnamed protein product [Polarella glacialis]